jgi:CelD/BcsL family acetyltransferase involved in cellulose biosynthesis
MLLVARLERYFAQGVREFDFIGLDEDYKLQWSRLCRSHESLRLYAPTLAARALFLSTDLRRQWRSYFDRSATAAPAPASVTVGQPSLARASLDGDQWSASA